VSPSYCHESLGKGAKFDKGKYFRNLDFATTFYGSSTPQLGSKLLETTINKIHKGHLSRQKFSIEIFLCHFSIQKNQKLGEFACEICHQLHLS